MRHFTRALTRTSAALACAVALATCADAPTGPSRSGMPVRLAFAPQFSASALSASSALRQAGIEVASVRVVIRRTSNGDELFNRVIAVTPGASSVTLEADVLLRSAEEELTAFLEFLDAAGIVLYRGEQRVIARAGDNAAVTVDAEIEFVGPGATAATVRVTPADTSISTATTLTLQAIALDAAGAPITGAILLWSSSDATLATVSTAGRVTPLGRRGSVQVSARTPLGVAGAATLRLMPPAVRMVVVGGGAQAGTAGATLAQPFTVEVQAADGLPVPGETVTFSAVTAGGAVTTATATTDAQGRASTPIKLGTTVGRYEFRAISGSLGAVTIAADASAGAASAIAILSGNAQSAAVGTALGAPFVVKVRDAFGNPVAGATVKWELVAGAGTLPAATSTTDASGHASMTYTTGTVPATESVKATLDGTSATVTFTATAVVGAAAQLAMLSGNSQSVAVGAALGAPLLVQVKDALGNPVAGAAVAWQVVSGTGTLSNATSVSDASGHASTGYTVGTVPATESIKATLTGTSATVTFTATAVLGAASQIAIVSGNGQTGDEGSLLASALVVSVTDAFGNPVPGAPVTWSVTSGNATLAQATTSTDASAKASNTVSLGNPAVMPASVVITAALASGTSVTFGATIIALPPVPAQLKVVTQPSSAAVGAVMSPPLGVRIADAAGVSIAQPGVSVTASVYAPSASIGPADKGGVSAVMTMRELVGTTTVTTDATGTANFADLVLTGSIGEVQVAFSATGLAGAVSSSIMLVAGTPQVISIVSGDAQTGEEGTALAAPLVVMVTDASGNPTPAAGVTWSVTSGNATVAQATTTADATARASNTVTLGAPATMPATAMITATLASGASVTFTATVTAKPLVPAGLVIAQQPPATARSGAALGAPVQVQVTDSSGAPIALAGQVVTVAVYSASANRLPADGSFAASMLQALTLSGTTSVATNASGIASFPDLLITGVEGPVTLSFTSGSLPVVSSNTITLTAGDVARLAILPSAPTASFVVTSGQPIGENVWLETADASGNRVPDVPVRFVTRSGGVEGPVVGDTTMLSNSIGEIAAAAFPVPLAAGTYHVTASIAVTGAAPVTFTVQVNASTAGATMSAVGATTIPINVGPVAIGSRSVVVRTAQGAGLPGLSVTYTLSGAGANGSFTGDVFEVSAITDSSGVASFPGGTLWTPPAPEGSYVMTVVARDGATQVGSSVTFTAVRTQWRYQITATPAAPAPSTGVALIAQLVDGNGATLTVSPVRNVTWSMAVGTAPAANFDTTSLASDGSTSTSFTSDAAPGAVHTVTVTDNSFAITGTSTVTNTGSSAPSAIVYGAAGPGASGDLQVTTVGGTLAQPLLVKVLDGNGVPVANAGVEWRRRSNLAEAVVVDTTTTDAAGVASLTPALPAEDPFLGHIFEASPVSSASLVLRFRAAARAGAEDAVWFGPGAGDGTTPLGYADWSVASHWSSGAVPGGSSNVLVPAWENTWVASPQLTGNVAVARIATGSGFDFPYLHLGAHELSIGDAITGSLVEGTGTIRMTGTSGSIDVHAPSATLSVPAGANVALVGFTRTRQATIGGTLQVGIQSLQLEGGELLVSGQLLMGGGSVYGGTNVVFDNTTFDSTNTGSITFRQLFEQRGATKLALEQYFTVYADVSAGGSTATIRIADSSSLGALVVTGPEAGPPSTLVVDGIATTSGTFAITGLVNVTGTTLRLASDDIVLPATADLSGLATVESRGYYAPMFAGAPPQMTELWAAELIGTSQFNNLQVRDTLQVYSHPFKVIGNLEVLGASGALRMMGQGDTVNVSGNVTFASDAQGNLRYGVVRIGGNLSYVGTADFRPDTLSTGTKFVFEGSSEQKVTFEPQLRGAVAYLGNVVVAAGSSVRQATPLAIKGNTQIGGTWIADSALQAKRVDVLGGEVPGRFETHVDGTSLTRVSIAAGGQWWNWAPLTTLARLDMQGSAQWHNWAAIGIVGANFYEGAQIWNYAGDSVTAQSCYNQGTGYVEMDSTRVYFSCTLQAPYTSGL